MQLYFLQQKVTDRTTESLIEATKCTFPEDHTSSSPPPLSFTQECKGLLTSPKAISLSPGICRFWVWSLSRDREPLWESVLVERGGQHFCLFLAPLLWVEGLPS